MKYLFVSFFTVFIFFSFLSEAQVIVKVKPVIPKSIKKATDCGPGRTWIDGHWRWDKRTRSYVWIDGHCSKLRRGYVWVPGHWADVPGRGYKWVPGHWARRR